MGNNYPVSVEVKAQTEREAVELGSRYIRDYLYLVLKGNPILHKMISVTDVEEVTNPGAPAVITREKDTDWENFETEKIVPRMRTVTSDGSGRGEEP